MTVYRLTRAVYAATAFDGSRGRGRWHRQGTPVVYAADAPATALVETLAHAESASLLVEPYVVFRVTLDPERHLLQLPPDELSPDWQAFPWSDGTQALGTLWFETAASVALEVPSAVVPSQRNVLLNPRHPLWKEIVVEGPEPFPIDPRLARVPQGSGRNL